MTRVFPSMVLVEAIGPRYLISIASGAIEVPEDRQGSSAFPRRIRRAADDRRHAFLDDRPQFPASTVPSRASLAPQARTIAKRDHRRLAKSSSNERKSALQRCTRSAHS